MSDLYLPPGPDPLTAAHRVESWWVDLLNADDVLLGRLDGVSGGQIDQSVGATISGGGSIEVDDLGQGADWLTIRVRPWWTVRAAGQVVSWPLGVFLASAPTAMHTETGRSWSVELLDKLVILDQDAVDGSYSLAAGTVVTTAVKAVIASAGETATAVTDSAETLTAGMVWPAGTSKLRIVNDLLAAINYFSLRCDGFGRYVAAPYIRPQDRPVAQAFAEGARAIHEAAFTRDQDLAAIPNKVVLVATATGDTEALLAVATNTDPASPYSYPSRGRWIVHTEEGVEATSQGVLDALADRRLADLSSATATLDIAHAAVPLTLNDAVTFASDGVVARGVVTKMHVTLEVGALMQTTVREVAP